MLAGTFSGGPIHSLANTYRAHANAGYVLGTKDAVVDENDEAPTLMKLIILVRE